MIEQQFLTTLTTLNRQPIPKPLITPISKHSNLMLDFINATYQGYLTNHSQKQKSQNKSRNTYFNQFSHLSSLSASKTNSVNSFIPLHLHTHNNNNGNGNQPEGNGVVIDDQFNFIAAEKWKKGKINGRVFVKLGNQVCVWGLWQNNRPSGLCCAKVGAYTLYIPFHESSKQPRRPKKCLAYNQQKNKAYIIIAQKYPQGSQNKREYSIIIEKIIPLSTPAIIPSNFPCSFPRATKERIFDLASSIDIEIQPYQASMGEYLEYLSQQVGCLQVQQKQNGIFISGKFEQKNRLSSLLGLLLDKKKLATKSVGTFSTKQQKIAQLSGIGHCKTIQNQSITGIFKDNMLIRQLSSSLPSTPPHQKQPNIFSPSPSPSSSPYPLQININIQNSSKTKQLLYHEHMKSLEYEHTFIYFMELKKINCYCIQLYKYVEMFQRLANNRGGINGIQSGDNQSQSKDGEHPTTKYDNQQYRNLVGKPQDSSGSIIDQFSQFKVNLSNDIYRHNDPKQRTQLPDRSHILRSDQNGHKKPGFIMNRSNRILVQGIKRPGSNSRSPTGSPMPSTKLNRKLQYRRSPMKTQTKWKI